MRMFFRGWFVFFSVVLTWATPSLAQSGWVWQNPLPQGNTLNAVAELDSQTAIAVGDGGTMLRTTDAGLTWTVQTSGTTNTLRGVSFADASTGWAVGDAGTILRTGDGGLTWTDQFSGSYRFWAVSFVDANIGTAVSDGTILRTTDGGDAWVVQYRDEHAVSLFGVAFVDAKTGAAVGYDFDGGGALILRTTDGGETWTRWTDR